jgi:hypothetical protein
MDLSTHNVYFGVRYLSLRHSGRGFMPAPPALHSRNPWKVHFLQTSHDNQRQHVTDNHLFDAQFSSRQFTRSGNCQCVRFFV